MKVYPFSALYLLLFFFLSPAKGKKKEKINNNRYKITKKKKVHFPRPTFSDREQEKEKKVVLGDKSCATS